MRDIHNKFQTQSQSEKTIYNSEFAVFGIIFIVYFLIQSLFFNYMFRPDENKVIDYLTLLTSTNVTPPIEFIIRSGLFAFNICLFWVLYLTHLIERQTARLALIWPLTPFLFAKIYWEFFVFPLCLIKLNTTPKTDIGLILFFTLLYYIIGEGNIIILILFRSMILTQKLGYPYLAPFGFMAFSFCIDLLLKNAMAQHIPFIGYQLLRFDWIRTIVNPEYSIFETIAIFLVSMHFFTTHTAFWQIDALFSILILCLIFSSTLNRRPDKQAWLALLALLACIVGFTTITHGFQNARYYFFFLPILSLFINRNTFHYLIYLGVLHIGLKCLEPVFLLL